KFIVARRIMYWQVYLHKTVLSAENMLIKILKRAEYLVKNGSVLFSTAPLLYFLENDFNYEDIHTNPEILDKYSRLDDFDILTSIKSWTDHEDMVLSTLSKNLINRRLFKCELQSQPFDYFFIENIKEKILNKYRISGEDLEYFFYSDTTSNYAYNLKADKINILYKSGKILDIIEASDQLNISVLSQAVTKHFICYPKDVDN
ncbi:MAG: phosphohydrolase, partial [Bacteroidales bacterium]|nr:phosphohydrolase [Bacteroidales bacterium]